MSDRPNYALGEQCHHGSLARQCELCELAWEVRRLRAGIAVAAEGAHLSGAREVGRHLEALLDTQEDTDG